MELEWVKKYSVCGWIYHDRKPCVVCGQMTVYEGEDVKTGKSLPVCFQCGQVTLEKTVAFPIKATFTKNLKNSFGMGNPWIERRPSSKFFDGISSNPICKDRIDFSSHVVYMTISRAIREGLLDEKGEIKK